MGVISIRNVRQGLATSGSTQDFTLSGFGTVKAYIIQAARGTSNGAAPDASISYGFSDGTRSRCIGLAVEHNKSPTETRRARYNSVVALPDVAGSNALDAHFDHNSFITDGVRLDVTSEASSAWLASMTLFGGSDLQVYVGELTASNTVDGTASTTDPGFEPDQVIFLIGGQGGFSDAVNPNARWWNGFATNEPGGIVQGSWNVGWRDGRILQECAGYPSDSYIGRRVINGSTSAAFEVTSFDANGFTVTTRLSGNNAFLGFIALKYGGSRVWTGRVDSRTSTGIQSTTSLNFRPRAMWMLGSATDNTIDTLVNNDEEAGVFSLGVATDDEEFSSSVGISEGGANTAGSIVDEKFVRGRTGSGAEIIASYSSLVDGFELDYTSVDSKAWKLWFTAVGEIEASGGSTAGAATSSGTAAIGRYTSAGDSDAAAVGSDGDSTIVRPASGDSEATATSSGTSDRVATASGNSNASAESSGTSIIVRPASGNSDVPRESAGDSTIVRVASGNSDAAAQSSGTAANLRTASGASESSAESSGTGTRIVIASGASTAGAAISSGEASGEFKAGSGNSDVGAVTSSGTGTRVATASGNSQPQPQSSGTAANLRLASGASSVAAESSGTSTAVNPASGGSTASAESAGTGTAVKVASGNSSPAHESSGQGTVVGIASGSSDATATSSGAALAGSKAGSGNSDSTATSSGAAVRVATASGDSQLSAGSSGSSANVRTASGSSTAGAATSSGIAAEPHYASGSSQTGATTSTGNALSSRTAAGSSAAGAAIGTGAAARIAFASGVSSAPATFSTGSAQFIVQAKTAAGGSVVGTAEGTGTGFFVSNEAPRITIYMHLDPLTGFGTDDGMVEIHVGDYGTDIRLIALRNGDSVDLGDFPYLFTLEDPWGGASNPPTNLLDDGSLRFVPDPGTFDEPGVWPFNLQVDGVSAVWHQRVLETL